MDIFRKRIKKLGTYSRFYRAFGWKTLRSLLGKEERVEVFGKELKYSDRFWFLHGLEEIFIQKVYLFKTEKKAPLIIDCGSNIGLSIIYFKNCHPDAKVIGFEPDPQNFQLLKENLQSFSLNDVEIVNKAVWKASDMLAFSSFGNVGSKLAESAEVTGVVMVPAVALSPYLEAEEVDFLKIDIEGAEFEVLESCKAVLNNVKNIFIEYHSLPEKPQVLSRLLLLLEEAGFRYYIKEAWPNLRYPYMSQKTVMFDLQLNIFAYRK